MMSADHHATGLRVLVTGAAHGIGFACASAFANRGAELILVDHDGPGLTRTGELLGGYCQFCDVISETSVAIFTELLAERFESFDILINAAGDGYVRSLGMMRMTAALLPLLRRAKGARLIFNIAPGPRRGDHHALFVHSASPDGFKRLSSAMEPQIRGSSIGVLAIPACDEHDVVREIVNLVHSARPEWTARRPAFRRKV